MTNFNNTVINKPKLTEMKRLTQYLAAVVMLTIVLAGCDKPTKLSIDIESENVAWDSKGQFMVINSSDTWAIEIECSSETGVTTAQWCTATPSYGSNSGEVWLSWSQNTGTNARRARVTVTTSRSGSQSVGFTQAGNENGSGSGGEHFPDWLELPAQIDNDNYIYAAHYASSMRNYTICYDVEKMTSLWVAYPLHACYVGASDRSDAWEFDPTISSALQTSVYKGYGDYATRNLDRGHQIPSADRTASVALNKQTFYFTNVTPQLGGLNQRKWEQLETWVRQQAVSDTLYVVTGALFQTAGNNEPIETILNYNDQKTVPLPNYYYKALLKRHNSSYTSIGFWMKHEAASGAIVSANACSVADIEQRSGFKFFDALPDQIEQSVKASFTAADWNW